MPVKPFDQSIPQWLMSVGCAMRQLGQMVVGTGKARRGRARAAIVVMNERRFNWMIIEKMENQIISDIRIKYISIIIQQFPITTISFY